MKINAKLNNFKIQYEDIDVKVVYQVLLYLTEIDKLEKYKGYYSFKLFNYQDFETFYTDALKSTFIYYNWGVIEKLTGFKRDLLDYLEFNLNLKDNEIMEIVKIYLGNKFNDFIFNLFYTIIDGEVEQNLAEKIEVITIDNNSYILLSYE